MKIKINTGIFDFTFEAWQDFLIIGFIVLIVLVIVYITVSFIVQAVKDKTKQVEKIERDIDKKIEKMRDKYQESEKSLDESRKKIDEKQKEIESAKKKSEEAALEMEKREREIKELLETSEMTKLELKNWQKKAKTFVSEDFIINTLTEKVLSQSSLEMRADVVECKVPKDITKKYTHSDVLNYLKSKKKIEFTDNPGKKGDVFKVNGITFALLYHVGDKEEMRITIKCGPSYAQKLVSKYSKGSVDKAKFPYGLLWFDVSNKASFEIVCQLIDISYRLAALGY